MKKLITPLLVSLLLAQGAAAETPEIVGARAERQGMGWRISVTLAHPDSGWDHFADAWEVRTEDGQVLGKRVLMHPHVDEQPFTRSLGNITVPDGVRLVVIRAHCLAHGWGPDTFRLRLSH